METIAIGVSEGVEDVRERLAQAVAGPSARYGLTVAVDVVERGRWRFLGCRFELRRDDPRAAEAAAALRQSIAGALTDVICRQWEPRLLRRLIRAHYDYFGPDEQERILGYAQAHLRREGGGRTGMPRATKVLARLQEYLDRHNSVIMDGFVTFRLKDYVEELEDAVDRAVDDYILEREYEEFVRLLRHFVEAQEPRVDTVHVVARERGAFGLLDERGGALGHGLPPELAPGDGEDVEYEDVLISALITMAPRRVVLHGEVDAGDRRHAVETIERVFETRVRRCGGCERCGAVGAVGAATPASRAADAAAGVAAGAAADSGAGPAAGETRR
ncbi:MAG: putative sporulation protein YtxC [Firmicutes bacterium]|nr:putative sporulation protein YtxC [Bacillota bacterium]